MSRSQIRRRKDDVWFFVIWHRGEPSAKCFGLLLSKLRQWDIDVAHADIDLSLAREKCCFSRDISSRLSMAHDVQSIGPDL
jgi:hypothetical protein